MNRLRAPFALLLATFVASANPAADAPTAGVELTIDSFEFLGCSGDWTEKEWRAEIWRMGSSTGTTYLVRHPDTCGSDTSRNAKATLKDGVLDLQYEPYSSDGVYAACPCEFWAKFTFKSEAHPVRSATFRQSESTLKGAWPER